MQKKTNNINFASWSFFFFFLFSFPLCFIIIFIQMYCKNDTGMTCHGPQQNIYHSMEVQSIMTTIIMQENKAKATLHPSSPIAITSMELTRFCIPFLFFLLHCLSLCNAAHHFHFIKCISSHISLQGYRYHKQALRKVPLKNPFIYYPCILQLFFFFF